MKKLSLKNQRGQMFVESILLMIIFVSISLMVSKQFRDKNLFASLIQGPWSNVAGMIEAGVWAPSDKAKAMHPNRIDRHHVVRGDSIQ